MRNHALRLHDTLAALCPLRGISVGAVGQSGSCVLRFDPAATAQQRADAQAALDSFDWSDAAYDSWEQQQQPQRTDLQQQAASAIQTNQDFLNLTAPTNAQVLAQVKALTRQNIKLIRRLIQL